MVNVRDKVTGKVYQAVPQMVDINFSGKFSLRYNIGIAGYNEFSSIHCIYSNTEFNEMYDVVEWNKEKKEWQLTYRIGRR